MFRSNDDFDRAIERNFIPFDENELVDWLVDANADDCITYYRGHLGRDRHPGSAILNSYDCPKLSAIASRIMTVADEGLVLLFQKRLGPHDYVYLAVRTLGRMGSPFTQVAAPALAA